MDKLYHLDVCSIQKYQRNKHPWLFVDEITEVSPGEYAKGYKNFTYGEFFFPGHFDDYPNVPGSIQLEVLLQVFLMTFLTIPEYRLARTADTFVSQRFRQEILSGNRLDVEAELLSFRRGVAKGTAMGYVAGSQACEGNFEVCIPEIVQKHIPRGMR